MPEAINKEERNSEMIPREVEQLEKVFGRFTAEFAKNLSEEIRGTAFCSPTSFRDPEIDNIWHPYLLNAHFIFFLKDQALLFFWKMLKGIKKFVMYRFGEFTFIPKEGSDVLGVSPTMICRQENGKMKTKYCHPDDVNNMSWLLFEDEKQTGGEQRISRVKILSHFIKVLWAWGKASFSSKEANKKYAAIASILALRWILELQWVNKWLLALELRRILDENQFKKVFCVHELHPHARIAWIEAKKKNIRTVTVLHARLARSELWYWVTKDELDAGMQLFDEITVFSKEDIDSLKSFYEDVPQYHIGCGPRYAHWKDAKELAGLEKRESILFASSLSWWDNEVVLKGLKKLSEAEGNKRPLAIRFHPTAVIPKRWEKWLEKECQNGIHVSKEPLSDAVMNSALIIGMSTTVLAEVLMMGRPGAAIEQEKFLSLAVPTVKPISLNNLNWETVDSFIKDFEERKEEEGKLERSFFGLDKPIFRLN